MIRAQNARHEANSLIRLRRGRTPHIVLVTAEPMPSRLASIARGTGEINRVYHVSIEALKRGVRGLDGNMKKHDARYQNDIFDELIENDRLADLTSLPTDLLL